jgi:hypothetical protein
MTGGILFLLGAVVLLSILLYFIPTVIAGLRGARHQVAILALNTLFGWTFIGWAAALVWALADEKGY